MESKDLKKLQTITRCKSMVESCVIYGNSTEPQKILSKSNRYLSKYVDSLGEETVLKMIQMAIDGIDENVKDAYTDSDGCTYNKVTWKRTYRRAEEFEKRCWELEKDIERLCDIATGNK